METVCQSCSQAAMVRQRARAVKGMSMKTDWTTSNLSKIDIERATCQHLTEATFQIETDLRWATSNLVCLRAKSPVKQVGNCQREATTPCLHFLLTQEVSCELFARSSPKTARVPQEIVSKLSPSVKFSKEQIDTRVGPLNLRSEGVS